MPIQRGAVYFVRPGLIRFLPKIKNPVKKERPVVVYACDDVTENPGWLYVSVLPISTSEDWATEHCVDVAPTESGGALRHKSWIRTSHMQPIAKSELVTNRYAGMLPPAVMREVDAAMVNYVGMDLS